jgi:hypothetical protein
VGGTCGMHGKGEECVQGFDGKFRRKEMTWKTKAQIRGWNQNGSYGDCLGEYRLDPAGSG